MKHRPLRAISLIDSLGLHDSIFTSEFNPPRQDALRCAEILSHLSDSFETRDEILWMGAALSPFRGLVCKQKKKEVPAISVVLSDSLKVSSSGVDVANRPAFDRHQNVSHQSLYSRRAPPPDPWLSIRTGHYPAESRGSPLVSINSLGSGHGNAAHLVWLEQRLRSDLCPLPDSSATHQRVGS
jgi:hypothetical protein